jgi:tight adherence protein C
MLDAGAGARMNALAVLLACGWGVLAGSPFVRRDRRARVASRFGRPASARRRRVSVPGPAGRVVAGLWRRRRDARATVGLERDLPAALDLLVVAVGAGCPPAAAIDVTARWGPQSVATMLDRVRAQVALGGSQSVALAAMATTSPVLAPVAEVLAASIELGAPSAAALTRLADDARAQLRRRAAARARTVPVKLLFPLVFLVLPAFGLLTVAPALISATGRL